MREWQETDRQRKDPIDRTWHYRKVRRKYQKMGLVSSYMFDLDAVEVVYVGGRMVPVIGVELTTMDYEPKNETMEVKFFKEINERWFKSKSGQRDFVNHVLSLLSCRPFLVVLPPFPEEPEYFWVSPLDEDEPTWVKLSQSGYFSWLQNKARLKLEDQ